jgi:hypothetical protein
MNIVDEALFPIFLTASGLFARADLSSRLSGENQDISLTFADEVCYTLPASAGL